MNWLVGLGVVGCLLGVCRWSRNWISCSCRSSRSWATSMSSRRLDRRYSSVVSSSKAKAAASTTRAVRPACFHRRSRMPSPTSSDMSAGLEAAWNAECTAASRARLRLPSPSARRCLSSRDCTSCRLDATCCSCMLSSWLAAAMAATALSDSAAAARDAVAAARLSLASRSAAEALSRKDATSTAACETAAAEDLAPSLMRANSALHAAPSAAAPAARPSARSSEARSLTASPASRRQSGGGCTRFLGLMAASSAGTGHCGRASAHHCGGGNGCSSCAGAGHVPSLRPRRSSSREMSSRLGRTTLSAESP
mmetsp:Transcript_17207/g.44153  ORF Transcript_17207/g.44153 Transcript_17207/m.44153 type:complete len:310 (-) Transcript_17207:641-1570(-)